MKFPWSKEKPEERMASYDQQLIAALHQAALGEAADVAATSAVQAAAGLIARCLSAATVTPQTPRTAVITPQYRYTVGESIVLRGEHVALIEVEDGAVRLTPASEWDIGGTTTQQREWTYRLQLPVPDGQISKTVSGASVVHLRIPNGQQPWQGTSALAGSHVSTEAFAALEDAMRQELHNATRAKLVSIPGFEDADPDDADDPWTALMRDIGTADGKSILMPAPATMIQGVGAASAPPQFGTVHLKPEIADDLQTLRDRLSTGLYNAVGIMTQVFDGGEATGIREAMRALHNLVLLPLGGLIEAELSQALETPVHLDFTRLQLGNLRERAQVVKALTDAGIELDEAKTLAGLSS